MKKILTVICILMITGGIVNAQPMKAPMNHQKPIVAKPLPMPKPVPVAYKTPVQVPPYNYYGNTPSVTFSVGNIDVTLGL